jgi:hypothetical protein
MTCDRLQSGPFPLLHDSQLADHLFEPAERAGRLCFPQPAGGNLSGHIKHGHVPSFRSG